MTRCREWGEGYEVALDDRYRYWVAHDGSQIVEVLSPPDADDSTVLLGPPLVLAMALRGTFYLHASAIAIEGEDGVVGLCGPSGAGKSTLAAAAGGSGWRRCADDLVAVAAENPAGALLHVPQLKLGDAEQPARSLPEEVPLRGIVWLDAPAEDGTPRLGSQTGAAAARRIVGATVAARLFPLHLATAHLAFCARMAAAVPVADLVYPRRLALLPEVLARLNEWRLASGPSA